MTPGCREQWALLDGLFQVKLKKKANSKAVKTLGEIKVIPLY